MIRPNILWIDLPSQGQFYNPTISANIPIHAQTAIDEILLRNADGLFNGSSTVFAINSAAPGIVDPWNMPICDLPAILTAIRIAIHGKSLDFESKCSKCNSRTEHSINLNQWLSSVSNSVTSDWQELLSITDQYIYQLSFKPITYKSWTEIELRLFKLSKTLWQIKQYEDLTQFVDIIKQLNKDLITINFDKIVCCINSVTVVDGASLTSVTDKELISEWVKNSNLNILNKIKEHVNKLLLLNQPNKIEVECTTCKNIEQIALDLDWSSSFRNKILTQTPEEINNTIKDLDKEVNDLQKDLLRIVWYMRGGISITEAQLLSSKERKLISDIINENMETTKKTGINFI